MSERLVIFEHDGGDSKNTTYIANTQPDISATLTC